jgi:hypothetical protein
MSRPAAFAAPSINSRFRAVRVHGPQDDRSFMNPIVHNLYHTLKINDQLEVWTDNYVLCLQREPAGPGA